MKKIHFALQLGMPVIGLVMSANVAFAQTPASQPVSQTVTSTDANRMAESIQFYRQMHAVLSHPRCVNCHPKDDSPKQGLDGHIHSPHITRGPENNQPLDELDRVVAAWAKSGGACPD